MSEPELFLETALQIGRRMARAAVWRGDGCSWVLSTGEAQSGNLYRGTAGVALFLAQLAKSTGDAECRRAAGGALRHALQWAAQLTPAHPGLFNGRLGIAWVAAHAGTLLGTDEQRRFAAAAVRSAASSPPPRGDDVIDGAAGAVLALLRIHALVPEAGAAEAAGAMGRTLLDRAVPEPWGWSWPAGSAVYVRNLLGYAHGASGIGHALLELAGTTGDAAFRYGAEQAFLYERRFHRAELGNWPDFRYAPDDAAHGGERGPAPYHPRYRTAWCHGATGIGLARVRAAELLGTDVYRDELRSAVMAALRYPRGPGAGFSLCHGVAGTAELLAEAGGALGEPALLDEARAMAAEGCERYERAGAPWPSGTQSGGPDPGLMLGDAGIGLMLLRLAGTGAPSPVLLRAPQAGSIAPDAAEAAALLARRAAEAHFGTALRVAARRGRAVRPPAGRGREPELLPVFLQLRAAAAHDALLADAFAPERTAFEMELGAIDRTEEAWQRGGEAEPDWGSGWIGMTGLARLVETEHDTAAWVPDAPAPPEDSVTWLVVRRDNRARARRLEPFAAAVLGELRAPRTLDQLVDAMGGHFPPGTAPAAERLRVSILEQLRALWQMGAVRADPEPPLEAALSRLTAAAAGQAPPAAIQARDILSRQVEWAREQVDGDDRLLAELLALAATSEIEAMLHAVHARALFAPTLAAVRAAPSADERLRSFRALLDAVGGVFTTDQVLLPGVLVHG